MRLCFAVVLAFLTGCASLQETFSSDKTNKVYAGVKKDWESITEKNCGGVIACEGLNPIVDLPLSAVMDTLLLPYTIPHRLAGASPPDKDEKKPEPLVAQQAAAAAAAASRPRR